MREVNESDAIDIHEQLHRVWRMLARGAVDAKDDCHWPVLSTVQSSPIGETPQARVIVLRACNIDQRSLELHTDARSAKMTQLTANPAASLTFYRSKSRLQIRAMGQVHIDHTTAWARKRWVDLGPQGHALYCAASPPGTDVDSPEIAGQATALDEDQGFQHFAVLTLHVERLEWLELARPFHRRGAIQYTTPNPQPRWLAP